MKLSEAIREGAKHYPQVKNKLCDRMPNGEVVGHCALGSAYYATKGHSPYREFEERVYKELVDVYPCLDTRATPPEGVRHGTDGKLPLENVIVALNDDYGWTREQIADWLESLGY